MLDESKPEYASLPTEVLQQVRWAEAWDPSERLEAQVSSTTLLKAPVTAAGLHAASTLLQWSVTANAAVEAALEAAGSGVSASSAGTAEDDEGPVVPPAWQRVGVVWDLPASGSVPSTCSSTEGEAGTCSAGSGDSPVPAYEQVQAVLSALTQLQEALSTHVTEGVTHCDVLCTMLMAKVWVAALFLCLLVSLWV
jgi:hypothetical protein